MTLVLLEHALEQGPPVSPRLSLVFDVSAGRLEIATSTLTLFEVLVVPYRSGSPELAGRYEAILTRSPGIRMIDLARDHLRLAGQLRAVGGIQTPDALQLAASLAAECSTFVTNDRRLPAVPGMGIIKLSDYAS